MCQRGLWTPERRGLWHVPDPRVCPQGTLGDPGGHWPLSLSEGFLLRALPAMMCCPATGQSDQQAGPGQECAVSRWPRVAGRWPTGRAGQAWCRLSGSDGEGRPAWVGDAQQEGSCEKVAEGARAPLLRPPDLDLPLALWGPALAAPGSLPDAAAGSGGSQGLPGLAASQSCCVTGASSSASRCQPGQERTGPLSASRGTECGRCPLTSGFLGHLLVSSAPPTVTPSTTGPSPEARTVSLRNLFSL